MAIVPWHVKLKANPIIAVVLFSLFLAAGCTSHQVKISGKIVSYGFIKLEEYKIRYTVMTMKDITQSGRASIRVGGHFTIRIKREAELPCWLVIRGFDNFPEGSIAGNSFEIGDNRKFKFDMGDVYIYNNIEERSNVVGPIDVEDIVVEWDTDIPNIDYFRIKLVGRAENPGYFSSAISVSGIKGNKFASVSRVLQTEGTHRIGDLVVETNNTALEGIYFLDIIAIRLIDGNAVEVGRSNSEWVTIVKNERI
jgi:hypothetical protein